MKNLVNYLEDYFDENEDVQFNYKKIIKENKNNNSKKNQKKHKYNND